MERLGGPGSGQEHRRYSLKLGNDEIPVEEVRQLLEISEPTYGDAVDPYNDPGMCLHRFHTCFSLLSLIMMLSLCLRLDPTTTSNTSDPAATAEPEKKPKRLVITPLTLRFSQPDVEQKYMEKTSLINSKASRK